jgi:hypothetical protein
MGLKRFGGMLGFLLLLTLLGGCAAEKPDGAKNEPPPVERQTLQLNHTVTVDGVGKLKGIKVNDIGLAIAQIQTTDTIDGAFAVRKAHGLFKTIRVVLTNGQKETITVQSTAFTLIDEQGRAFTHSIEGDTALQASNRETLFSKKIAPGATAEGWIAFDVPIDAKITSLQYKVDSKGKTGELPFKVIPDTP